MPSLSPSEARYHFAYYTEWCALCLAIEMGELCRALDLGAL